jgi:hypothetical protein
MTVEEWKALSDQMLAYSNRYKHSGAGRRRLDTKSDKVEPEHGEYTLNFDSTSACSWRCGFERDRSPGCTGVGRAVETAPIRAGIEQARIARAHREARMFSEPRPPLVAAQVYPLSGLFQTPQALRYRGSSAGSGRGGYCSRTDRGATARFVPIAHHALRCERGSSCSGIHDVRVDHVEDNGIDPSAIPPISSCSGISPLLTFFHPIPALSDR